MKRFKEFISDLNETYHNLFTLDEKRPWAQQVWDIVNLSYERIGGIHGSGFKSVDDMIRNIPMWKLDIVGGVVKAAKLYKDKDGRKSVAVASDGTSEGKEKAVKMIVDDIRTRRTFVEISGAPVAVLKKNLPHYVSYAVTVEDVMKKLSDEIRPVSDNDPEVIKFPELKEFYYSRKIGGEWHTKVMFGNINSDRILIV